MWPSQRLSISLESGQRKAQVRRKDRRARGIRPIVTLLEERTLLSTLNLTVTTLLDDPTMPIHGQVTLRDAITTANADTTDSQEIIGFAPGLQGTIDLTTALPNLNNNITINGPGAANLTVCNADVYGLSIFTVEGDLIKGASVNLSGMTITGGEAGEGSGIYYNGVGTLTVANCTFADNSSEYSGGGIFDLGGTLIVTNSIFTQNSGYYGGGGICDENCTLTVNGSTFVQNFADQGSGGGIYNGTATIATVTNCTFTDNYASGNGGGVYNYSPLTVVNCTISGNTSQYGGGIYNGATLTINNTIVAGNTGEDIYGPVQATSNNNLIGNGTGITNLSQISSSNLIGTIADHINPLLGPLQNNGGPTETMALLPGSPAINAGSVGLAVDTNGNLLSYDQRGAGYPRIFDGTVDIGAYESPYQVITFGPLVNQTYGVAPITLTATASSGLTVRYTVISGPATISGDVLTIIGAGLVDVEADQAGNATYAAATPVDESFVVCPALLARFTYGLLARIIL